VTDTDPTTLPLIMQAAGLLGLGVIGLLSFSLRRNVSDQDARSKRIEAGISEVAADVRQLTSTVGTHGESLAEGRATFRGLQESVKGLEERERQRGCFGTCRFRGVNGDAG
jgi:hypothetical protein